MLSPQSICDRRSWVARTLLGAILVSGTLTFSSAAEKHPKHHEAQAHPHPPAAEHHKPPEVEHHKPAQVEHHNPPAVEHVARVEREAIRIDATPAPQNTNPPVVRTAPERHSTGDSRGSLKFTPDFSHESPRTRLQPRTVNLPQPNGSAAQTPSTTPSQITFLQKLDKQKANDKNKEKPPKPERAEKPQPKEPQPEQPKHVKPMNDAPKVVAPKVESPRVEQPKVEKPKVERPKTNQPKLEQPKVERPSRSAGTTNNRNMENKTGGQIRIRKTPDKSSGANTVPDATVNPETKIRIKKPDYPAGQDDASPAVGKVRLRTPQADKNPGDNPARHVDKVDKTARLKDGATLTRDHHEQIKRNLDKEHGELVKQGKVADPVKVKLPQHTRMAGAERLERLPHEALKLSVPKNGKIDPSIAAKLKRRPAHDVLNTRLKNGDFQHLANLKSGHTFQLNKQFQLHHQGDVGRRLNLIAGLQQRGGWRHRYFGPISPIYSRHCRSMWYAGPSFCSPYVWYPSWSPWVDWCWWDTCAPIYDPRPIFCQPIIYNPCSPWVAWQYPTWQPLPYVTCGTWVDVDPVVINAGIDLQLLATRFVDPGHPDHELGPRFRVWIRNNSPADLNQAFNVMLIASNDANAYAGLPEAGVRVLGLRAGETQAIDIRLPYAANSMGRDSSGRSIPFTYLTALVDSHNELPEAIEANNGATLVRGDILPVDPAAFAADPSSSRPNGVIHVAGEGLGPEPGQAMVVIGDQEFQAEIVGWFDLGIQIRLPDFELDAPTAADLVIIRGDGAASNPLTIEIDPAAEIGPAPEIRVPELPAPPPLPEPVE